MIVRGIDPFTYIKACLRRDVLFLFSEVMMLSLVGFYILMFIVAIAFAAYVDWYDGRRL